MVDLPDDGLRGSGPSSGHRGKESPRVDHLGTATDMLIQAELPELGDLLVQRLKAHETTAGC